MRLARVGLVALGAALLVLVQAPFSAAGSGAARRAHAAAGCSDPYPATRNPRNPLMLATAPPGSNPLAGAQFFVDGPAHGAAAGAIARLLGIDTGTPQGSALPSFSVSESWSTFAKFVARKLRSVKPGVAYQIRELEKIASQPEAQRISVFSAGGTPTGIFDQTQKLFCSNFTADPGTIPIITTYFLHAKLGGCSTSAEMNAYRPTFEQQINAIASATGNRPVVYLLELDAVGSSACMAKQGDLGTWESLLRYEADTLGALPHAVVYLEGGYSDANNPAYAAKILNASGIRQIEGFFTNDTHLNWTINEIHYGQKIAKLTHGAHFIIDTADNGNGPLLNPHPTTQGIENLCNPPGRALGPRDTTATGFKYIDAFLWTHVPGNSSGCGGGPPSGDFYTSYAVGLASRANARLGPHDASRRY